MNDFFNLEKEVLNLDNEITFISAVAGGGKTSLIIKKILQLILNGIPLKKIFVITYTNEAVNEIKIRIEKKFLQWRKDENFLFEDLVFFLGENNFSNSLFDSIKKKYSKFENSNLENKIDNLIIKKISKNQNEENFYKKSKFSNYITLENLKKLKSLSHDEIKISTFHSFCFDFLKRFSKEHKFFNFKIISQIEKELIVSNLVEKEYLNFDFFKFEFSKNQIKKILIKTIDFEINENFIFENNELKNNFSFESEKKNEIKNFYEKYKLEKNINLSKTEENFLNQINVFLNKKFFHEKQKLISYIEIFFTKDFEIRKNYIKILEEKTEISFFIENEIKFLQQTFKNLIFSELIVLNRELKNFFIKIKNDFYKYKKNNKICDFDEIISNFHELIFSSDEKENFLFELKKQFNHLIIDEAQDNSKKQWEIIKILADEIFHKNEYIESSEINNSSSEKKSIDEILQNEFKIIKEIYEKNYLSNFRSLFIVGDVKQSIYSFQNASPELFLINKEYFKKKSFSYKVKFKFINWNFCFRIGEKNLNFIDKYFNKNKITNELFQSENLSHISLSSENNSDFLILD